MIQSPNPCYTVLPCCSLHDLPKSWFSDVQIKCSVQRRVPTYIPLIPLGTSQSSIPDINAHAPEQNWDFFLFYRGMEKNWIKEILLNLVRLKQNEQYCLVVPNIHGVLSAEKIPNIHFSPDKLKGFVGGSWFSFCLVRMILFLKVIRHFDDLLVWPFVKYKSPRTYKMWIWQVSKWDREQAARGLQSLLVLLHISG